jgi:hypothetical protein
VKSLINCSRGEKRQCQPWVDSPQVPVEMNVLSSQSAFTKSGIVDATQFGNIPAASFRNSKFYLRGK